MAGGLCACSVTSAGLWQIPWLALGPRQSHKIEQAQIFTTVGAWQLEWSCSLLDVQEKIF